MIYFFTFFVNRKISFDDVFCLFEQNIATILLDMKKSR